MATGGVLGIWIKDILGGRTPRDLDAETFTAALSSNGAGGLAGLAMNNLYYDSDIVSTPASAFIRPASGIVEQAARGSGEGVVRETSRFARRTIPMADIWFARGAVDLLVREGIGLPLTRQEKRKMKERGQKIWLK